MHHVEDTLMFSTMVPSLSSCPLSSSLHCSTISLTLSTRPVLLLTNFLLFLLTFGLFTTCLIMSTPPLLHPYGSFVALINVISLVKLKISLCLLFRQINFHHLQLDLLTGWLFFHFLIKAVRDDDS